MDQIKLLVKDVLHKIQDIPDVPCKYRFLCVNETDGFYQLPP